MRRTTRTQEWPFQGNHAFVRLPQLGSRSTACGRRRCLRSIAIRSRTRVIVSGSGTMFTDGYTVNGRHNLSPDLECGMAYKVAKKDVTPT